MAFVRPVTKTIISTTEFGQEVYDRLIALGPGVGPWVALPLQAGWSGWSGNDYGSPACRLEAGGKVIRLSGLATRSGAAINAGDVISLATIPASFPLPAKSQMFVAMSLSGAQRITVLQSGLIQLNAFFALANAGFQGVDGLTISVT